MKKIIIFGGFFAAFLLLMISNVSAVENNQASSNIAVTISVLTQRISRLLEQADEKQISSLSKWIDIENLIVFIDEITNNGNSICPSCEPLCRPLCLVGLIYFLSYMLMAIVCFALIVTIRYGIMYVIIAMDYYHHSEDINCFWVYFISSDLPSVY
jgi:ABC-type siderophore export system fused ATPase/permease subunit